MGLLGSIVAGAAGQMLGGGNKANLINMVLGMVQGQQGGGGLGALVQQFTQAGFGQQAQSWVSTGANLPISPDDMTKVFGQGQMQQFGQQMGGNSQEAASGLSSLLPEIINQLTPQGNVTEGSQFDGLLGVLKSRLLGG